MNQIDRQNNLFIQRMDMNAVGAGSGGSTSGANSDFLFGDTAGYGVNNDGNDSFVRKAESVLQANKLNPLAKKLQLPGWAENIKIKFKDAMDSLKSPETLESEKEEKINELQAEIDAATEAYEKAAEELNAELEEIKAEAEEYENQMAEIDEEIAGIDEQINENDNQIAEKDAQIAEKDDAIAEKDSAIADKDSQISEVSNQISSIGDEIASLNGQISSLQSQLSSLSTSTGDEETDAANASARASLESQIADLQAQKSEKEQQKSELEAKKADLEAEKDKLQSEKEELKAQKDELNAQKDELEAKNDELKAQKEPLEAEKAKLEEQKAALDEKQAQVEQKIEDNENSENKKLMDEGPAKIQAIEQEYAAKIEAAKERDIAYKQPLKSFNSDSETELLANKSEEKLEAINIGSTLGEVLEKDAEREKNTVVDAQDRFDIMTSGPDQMHTEFGMDEDGNIVFQEDDTELIFRKVTDAYIDALDESGELDALGGVDGVRQIIQSAWIAQYADVNSSQSNDTSMFVAGVFSDADRLIAAAKSDPAVLATLAKHTAYADESLTEGLRHYDTNTTYGGDEKIDYSGDIVQYEDGTIHISNTKDDKDYQATMEALFERIKDKYSELDEDEITFLFRTAQMGALQAMQSNDRDCPYGTGCNDQRVEDGDNKDWGGNDNRKGDDSVVHMDELVQMTLYYFDKKLYTQLIRGWDN